MARIAGIDIPNKKVLWIALTYIYGIGRITALNICRKSKIDKNKRVSELTNDEKNRLNKIITSGYKIEGDLRSENSFAIKRLKDIGSYRGMRHIKGLPVRGQRTHSNARTRKGPKGKLVKKK